MLSNLYYKKKIGIPWVSLLFIITCTGVWILTRLDNNLYYVFASFSRPKYYWQYFAGTFQHAIYPNWFSYAHFLGNMSVIIVLGVLIERVIGTKKFILLSMVSAIMVLLTFHITATSDNSIIVGISGIAWAYGPVSCYILYRVVKQVRGQIMKDILFWLIIVELFFIWIFVTAGSSMDTNIWHLVATIVGILYIILFKSQLNTRVKEILGVDKPDKLCLYSNNKKAINFLCLIPIGFIVIIVFYSIFGLDNLFVEQVSISPCNTVTEINENDSAIVIEFNDTLTNNGITSMGTSFNISGIEYEIKYSDDRKKAIIDFKHKLPEDTTGEINIMSAEFKSGKILKPQKIVLD